MGSAAKKLIAIAFTGLLASAQGCAGADGPGFDAVAACLAPGTWSTLRAGPARVADPGALIAELSRHDVLLLGERHDRAEDHLWQLQTLAAVHALRPQMVIGFESFPRAAQPVLDRWIAGELSEQQLLRQSEWDKVWKLPPQLYLPLFQFARINRIPMLALNVNRELTRKVTTQGWDAVPESLKEGVTKPAAPPEAYRRALFDVYKSHVRGAGKGEYGESSEDKDFRYFTESQTTWDAAMAQALSSRLRKDDSGRSPLVVGIIGSGHLRFGHGVAHQLRHLGVTRIGTALPVPAHTPCDELQQGLADAVFSVPALPHAPPSRPRLGVQLEQTKDSVRIVAVVNGSLAQRTGLRKDDQIESLAGSRVANVGEVVVAIRAQPAGTWLPITVVRDGTTLELVIKFPPRK